MPSVIGKSLKEVGIVPDARIRIIVGKLYFAAKITEVLDGTKEPFVGMHIVSEARKPISMHQKFVYAGLWDVLSDLIETPEINAVMTEDQRKRALDLIWDAFRYSDDDIFNVKEGPNAHVEPCAICVEIAGHAPKLMPQESKK